MQTDPLTHNNVSIQVPNISPTLALDPSKPVRWIGYPLPELSVSNTTSTKEVELAELVAGDCVLGVAPALGGRILSLRTGEEPILAPPTKLHIQNGSARGIVSGDGIRLAFAANGRMSDLSLVTVLQNEEGLEIAGRETGQYLSWQVNVSPSESGSVFSFQFRVLNEGNVPVPAQVGLLFPQDWLVKLGGPCPTILAPSGGGVVLFAQDFGLGSAQTDEGHFVGPLPENDVLLPREHRTFTFSLAPFRGLSTPLAASRSLLIGQTDQKLEIISFHSLSGVRVGLQQENSEWVSALVDLEAGVPTNLDLPFAPKRISIIDSLKHTLLDWPEVRLEAFRLPNPEVPALPVELSTEELFLGTLSASTRMECHLRLAQFFGQAGDFGQALEHGEAYLLYNGDDPLGWLMQAIFTRLHAQGAEEESPYLLNAHFLAPLHPFLKVEAFLNAGEDGSVRLLESLSPDDLLDAADFYLSCAPPSQAARVVEALKELADGPMCRYLLAYFEAAIHGDWITAGAHVAAGDKLAPTPPFPWRKCERKALKFLCERIKEDAALHHFLGLAQG